jgi:CRP/FNR family transcriptional regulator
MKINETIPFFENAEDELVRDFRRYAVTKTINKGQFLTIEGDRCGYFPIVKSGIVRVYKLGENGQEFTLYRINPGESCILTISCILSNNQFPALAFIEEDCELILIPSEIFNSWVKKYSLWNEYVFGYMSSILNKVISVIESFVFTRTDFRIIEFLLKHSVEPGDEIILTHQNIANELGTAREVVSRILKNLEKEKVIEIARGKIKIINIKKLKAKIKLLQ